MPMEFALALQVSVPGTKLLRNLLIASIAIGLTGCSSTPRDYEPGQTTINLPPLASDAQGELGDTLVQRAVEYTRPALRLSETLEVSGGWGVSFTLPPQTLVEVSSTDDEDLYRAPEFLIHTSLYGTTTRSIGIIAVPKNGDKMKICLGYRVNGKTRFEIKSQPRLERMTEIDLEQPYFRQELIYNGRSGNTLKFLYREFSNDLIRGAFNQEVQYDLKDGNIVGFKGARLLVKHASNTAIQYQLLSSFRPEP